MAWRTLHISRRFCRICVPRPAKAMGHPSSISPRRAIQRLTGTSTHTRPIEYSNISDAQVYDIKDDAPKAPTAATQKEIDEIPGKISHGGYQSLSDEERKNCLKRAKS